MMRRWLARWIPALRTTEEALRYWCEDGLTVVQAQVVERGAPQDGREGASWLSLAGGAVTSLSRPKVAAPTAAEAERKFRDLWLTYRQGQAHLLWRLEPIVFCCVDAQGETIWIASAKAYLW